MKKRILFTCLVCLVATAVLAQHSKTVVKINALGGGFGVEYFVSPSLSVQSEMGLSYWEKLNDKIQNKHDYEDIVAFNPYISNSIHYYFSPMHQAENGNYEIGWRITGNYTGLFTQSDYFHFNDKNSHRFGIFAGTNIHFGEHSYLEVDLGPGYEIDPFKGNRLNLMGKVGFGFRF